MVKRTVPRGDKGFQIPFTAKNGDTKKVIILTGYTVYFKVWKPGQSDILLINGLCTPDDEELGTCHYTVKEGDFDKLGRYYGELELTNGGAIESTQPFMITVVESG